MDKNYFRIHLIYISRICNEFVNNQVFAITIIVSSVGCPKCESLEYSIELVNWKKNCKFKNFFIFASEFGFFLVVKFSGWIQVKPKVFFKLNNIDQL